MVNRLLLLVVCLTASTIATPGAQSRPARTDAVRSDLDDLMARVLARRDDNWKKLQQYTLNERETVQVSALAVFRLFGFEREYLWFPRAGFFVRSPLTADGVTIDDERRRREEDRWLRRAEQREERTQRRAASSDPCAPNPPATDAAASPAPSADTDLTLNRSVEDIVSQSFEPDFIRSANFLQFKFEEGQYALVGREKMLDRDVLKIEYYPRGLFNDDERCPRRERRAARNDEPQARDKDGDKPDNEFDDEMNKVSLVTMWVDPAEQQILRYEFRNIDMDFLPGRRIIQIDGLRATMQMGEPFPNVWLPASISMRFRAKLAVGPVEGRYDVKYSDYRLPTVSGRVR